MQRFSRSSILEKLNRRASNCEPILICEAGVGIIGKMAEAADVDMILIDNAAMFRMRGVDDAVAYRPYGDTNQMVYSLANRIQSVVQTTPVIAGIAMADPNKQIDLYVEHLLRLGISGVANIPSVGPLPASYRFNIEKNNLGVKKEIAIMKACRKKEILTLGQGFYEDDLCEISAAGIDIVCINMRFAVESETNPDLYNEPGACFTYINELIAKIKRENKNNFIAIYGGPFKTYSAIERCFQETNVDVYISTDYSDAIPMRERITKAVYEFSSFSLGEIQ